MGFRKVAFAEDEFYHVYGRGVNKMRLFECEKEYTRFLLLLLLANQDERVHLSNLLHSYKGLSLIEIFEKEAPAFDDRLVDVRAYCLMPNHFHVVLGQRKDNGITDFMRKLLTGYSMYFNKKHERTGPVFEGKFKAQHIDSDPYFRHIFAYVHLNPVDLYQKGWKDEGVNKGKAVRFLKQYQYSSFQDYFGKKRAHGSILTMDNNTPWKKDFKKPEQLFDFYDYEG